MELERSRHRVVAGAGAAAALALALAAGITAAESPDTNAWSLATDLAVGGAFLAAAFAMQSSTGVRLLVAGVGVAWLLGSLVPALRLSHLAVLALALLAFPASRPRGPMRWGAAAGAVLAFGVLPRPWPAIVFAVIGIVCLRDAVRSGGSRWFSVAGALLMSGILLATWLWQIGAPATFIPSLSLRMYEATLTVVALGFWLASRRYEAERHRTTDVVLGDDEPMGLDGIGGVLADALDDPSIRVVHAGDTVTPPRHHTLGVWDGDQLVATVHHDADSLSDPQVTASVAHAVRLVLAHERLTSALEHQFATLDEARRRQIGAVARRRDLVASRLHSEVVAPLEQTQTIVEKARRAATRADTADALDIVLDELTRAGEELLGLIADAPRALREDGGLVAALEEFARRSPTPIALIVPPRATWDAATAPDGEIERVLFYVANEAVTNALKHARASTIEIALRCDAGLVLVVADDGIGGAEPTGSGMRGMKARLDARGGRLEVLSPPARGTTVTATLPLIRSVSTA